MKPAGPYLQRQALLGLTLQILPALRPVPEPGTFCHRSATIVVEGTWLPKGVAILFHLPPPHIHV